MLQNKNFTKVISLVLAIFLWIYVVSVENPLTKVKIPNVAVQLLNVETLSQRGLALSEDEEYYVDVVIEGKRADVLKIAASDVGVTADVFGYSIGKNDIPITVTVPDSVTVADLRTGKIAVSIEELVSVYKSVKVLFSGVIPKGTEPTIFDIEPEEVEVKGAKSKVASVADVTATVDVDQLGSERSAFAADLHAIDANGEVVSGVKLSASSVQLTGAVFETKEVPLNLEVTGEVSAKYEVTKMDVPEKVTIKGLKVDVSKVNSVTAAAIDISSISSTTEIPINMTLPTGVMLSEESKEAAVSVTIKGISVKEFEIDSSNITYEGLSERLSVVVNTPSVVVNASGKESIITNMTADDMHLSIDLTDLGAGVHTVPVKLSYEENLSEGLVTPSEIHITINEAV